MPPTRNEARERRPSAHHPAGTRSFTLIETVIALAIITFLIIQVASVQGNAIIFSDYGRNVTQATWLARRVLSQVEYFWQVKPFKELKQRIDSKRFEDYPDYSYSLEIKEWKFPLEKLLAGGLTGSTGSDDDEEGSKDSGMGKMIEDGVKQVFGDEPKFLTAFVEVSWSEGAQKNSTSMTYLLTNQAKIDEFMPSLKQTYDQCTKQQTNCQDPKNRTKPECAGKCQPQATDPCCTKEGNRFPACQPANSQTWPPIELRFDGVTP